MKLTQLGSLYKLIRGESRTMRKSVTKQPRQRASAFVLESLENRVLLSATPMDVTTTEPVVTAAVVTTDKADYAPGETALITTSNTSAEGLKFGEGELVQFQVTRTDGIEDAPMGNLPWYVTDGVGGFAAHEDTIVDSNNDGVAESGDRNADGMADWILPDTDLTVNGSISTNWFVEDQYLGASLLLTATGQASGAVATTEFTDSPLVNSVSVGVQTGSAYVGTGTSVSYNVSVTKGTGNGTVSFSLTTALPTGVTANFSGDVSFAGSDASGTVKTTTLTLTTTGATPAGSAGFTVKATKITGGGTDFAIGSGTLLVNSLTSITPTFTASPKTYNGNNSATVSFTGFSPSVGANNVTVSYTSATFSDANAGTGKTVTIAGLSLSGVDAYKYTLSSTTASTTATIAQADANVSINPYSGTYDAAAHNLTGSVTGVAGDLSANGSSLTFGASFTDAGSHTGSWTFEGGTNYLDESGTAAVTIAQADLTINIGSTAKTFGQTINLATLNGTTVNGTPVTGTTVNTGVNGEILSITYTSAGVPVAALVGSYAITGSVSDGTGILSNYHVINNQGTLTVTTPSVITSVQDGNNLIIVGTGGCDTITVNATNPNSITVNGAGSYFVGAGGHVIVYGMACDDNISLIGNINLEAHGGDGNDTITGGAGHDVIFGDTGNDTLTGAAGNDVLVGGSGSDRLVGSAGHDILVSGDLTGTHNGNAYDYNTLRLISDNWAAANASADPDLESPSDDVVDESGSVDQLTGSAGHDWFIIGSTDKITDINSTTKDGDHISYT